jgi:hypothetical protein
MDDQSQPLRDEMASLRAELSRLRAQIGELRTVLSGGANPGGVDPLEIERTIREGALAHGRGLTTSPYGESSEQERWWRFGSQLAKQLAQTKTGWH